MLTVAEARKTILGSAQSLPAAVWVSLLDARGAVLARDVVAHCNVPPCDNSAMDGYAVCTADLAAERLGLVVDGVAYAGSAPTALSRGTAQRIFTGAPVPVGADAIVMQENVRREHDRIFCKNSVTISVGEHIRRAGEDIRRGDTLFARGHKLRAQDIGLLASVGCAQVEVFRKLRVGLFCTGDELREPGEALLPGQIYNSNRYLLTAMLQDIGCEVIDAGIVADTLDATIDALQSVAKKSDVVLGTGGVSVGDADFVKAAVLALGQLDVWKIAVKPGKPLAFGSVCEKVFFGLPGNPVSAFVTFWLFVRPFLHIAQGGTVKELPQLSVQAGFDWPHAGTREEYLRVRLVREENTPLRAMSYHHQGSGVLSSVCWADALLCVPIGKVFRKGDAVDCLLLSL
jgi:molybdopterin molybdotransferase